MTHGQTRGRKQSRLYRIWSCYMRYNNCNLLDRKGEIKNVEIER